MRRAVLVLVVALVALGAACGGHPAKAPAGVDPRLVIAVDRRVEVISIVARLAGFPEYGKPAVTSYARAVDEHFAPFRDHPAVAAMAALRREHEISFNAPIGLAVYLDAQLAPRRPLVMPLPHLDERWNDADATGFVAQLQDFARASDFDAFFAGQADFRRAVEARVATALAGHRVVAWFDAVFGPRPTATFLVIPGLLSGTMAYSAQAVATDGTVEVAQVLALLPPGADGVPVPPPDVVYSLVHEFAHSYVNPILDARRPRVMPAAEPLFARLAEIMSRQHYPTAAIMANESAVRAMVVLYARERGPEGMDVAQMIDERKRGFLWIKELAAGLGALRRPVEPDAFAETTAAALAAWAAANPS